MNPIVDQGGGFLIPYARGRGLDLVHRSAAVPGEEYRCPGCGERLSVRDGDVRRKHYAHDFGRPCSPETVIHKTAKLIASEWVKPLYSLPPDDDEWISDWSAILIYRCANCGKTECQALLPFKCMQDASNDCEFFAVVEHRHHGYTPDVCVQVRDYYGSELGPSRCLIGIEVRVTHAVEEKHVGRDLPWIEVDGAEVVSRYERREAFSVPEYAVIRSSPEMYCLDCAELSAKIVNARKILP